MTSVVDSVHAAWHLVSNTTDVIAKINVAITSASHAVFQVVRDKAYNVDHTKKRENIELCISFKFAVSNP